MGSSTVMYDDASNPVTFKGEDAKNLVNGVSVKAWVNFNGTGIVAIRDSFNVSSITDIGVGKYTINFSTPFNNTNYGTVGMGKNEGADNATRNIVISNTIAPTVSSISLIHGFTSASTLSDTDIVNVVIFNN